MTSKIISFKLFFLHPITTTSPLWLITAVPLLIYIWSPSVWIRLSDRRFLLKFDTNNTSFIVHVQIEFSTLYEQSSSPICEGMIFCPVLATPIDNGLYYVFIRQNNSLSVIIWSVTPRSRYYDITRLLPFRDDYSVDSSNKEATCLSSIPSSTTQFTWVFRGLPLNFDLSSLRIGHWFFLFPIFLQR